MFWYASLLTCRDVVEWMIRETLKFLCILKRPYDLTDEQEDSVWT